jgi:hypothetical protein
VVKIIIGIASVGLSKTTWRTESRKDFSRFKPNLPSSDLKDNLTGREIMLSQLSQVVLILKGVLETTGMWTLAVLFICQISFIFFSNYQSVNNGSWPVKGVGHNNNMLKAKGMGDVLIQTNVNEEWHSGILKNVLFVPDLGVNLFSVRSATRAGLVVMFNNNQVTICKGEKILAVGESFSNHLYRLNIRSVKSNHPKVGHTPQTAFHALYPDLKLNPFTCGIIA